MTVPAAPGRSITIWTGPAKNEPRLEVLLIGFAGDQGSGKTWWRRRVEAELSARQKPARLVSEMPHEEVMRVEMTGMREADIIREIIEPIVREIIDTRRPKQPEQIAPQADIDRFYVELVDMAPALQKTLHAHHPLLAEHIAATLAKIGREMVRQIVIEGFGPAHDDQYRNGELEHAASSYALTAQCEHPEVRKIVLSEPIGNWPWPVEWWKPKTPERDAVRAAALLGAALMRRDREEAAKEAEAASATRQQAEG
ncbi:hypothetical protein P24_15049 [Oceanibaculum indicum P24]|uniref:Uncharacterized protein n=2 Tax=Oceanibaculum indicum TaxID=526216 RepID=K2IL62_9PROT|nr:hypothetical protein P24_15049 [Oceanibaculum indicum P24]